MALKHPVLGWSALLRFFFAPAIALSSIDQLVKIWATENLEPYRSEPFIGYLLRLYLAYNDSAAFSLGAGQTWIFTIISSAAAVTLVWFAPKVETRYWAILGGILLGGVVGNLADRLFRQPGFAVGEVVDYLQLPFNFPIFNLADILIVTTVSIAGILVISGREVGKAKKRNGDSSVSQNIDSNQQTRKTS